MRTALWIVVVFAACSKGSAKGNPDPAPAPKPSAASAEAVAASPTELPAEPVEQEAKGIAIKSATAEFSGGYDKVFGRFTNQTEPNVIVFVRGCPKLTCDPGPWEPEQVAHVCPKAYLATATFPGEKAGKFKVDLKIAGPVGNPSTGTVEGVWLNLSKLDNDGITGTASLKSPDAGVKGEFTAVMCPRT